MVKSFPMPATRPSIFFVVLLGSLSAISKAQEIFCQCETFPIDDKPFVALWNSPTGGCQKNFSIKIELEDFKIRANSRQTWNGKYVVVFYNAQLGYYPYFTNPFGTRSYNGGMPQLININAHLEKSTRDIVGRIPDPNFNGVAVIDWEGWRPIWQRNWDSKKVYQTRSIEILRFLHPDWPIARLIERAQKQFEDSARIMMLETLKLGKHLRPKAKWGFYGFPDCYRNENTNYMCSDEVKDQNDRLHWMFSTSTALFPSIYLPERSETNAAFIRGRLFEAFRLSNRYKQYGSSLPVFPYFRFIYEKNPLDYDFLTDNDLRNTIGQAVDIGAAGIVMWGNRRDENTSPGTCRQINDYVHNKLGPYFKSIETESEKCSNRICNGNGRCINRNLAQTLGIYEDDLGKSSCPPRIKENHDIPEQRTKTLENTPKGGKQIVGAPGTGQAKVINVHQHKNKLKGLTKTLANIDVKTDIQKKKNTEKNKVVKADNSKLQSTVKKTKDKNIGTRKYKNIEVKQKPSDSKTNFVKIIKPEMIPFLDADYEEDDGTWKTKTKYNNGTAYDAPDEMSDTPHEIPSETIFCNKTESGTTKCMLVKRHKSMKLSKHNGFQIPKIYAILISISLGGALVLSTVYIGTYYYFNVFKKKRNLY